VIGNTRLHASIGQWKAAQTIPSISGSIVEPSVFYAANCCPGPAQNRKGAEGRGCGPELSVDLYQKQNRPPAVITDQGLNHLNVESGFLALPSIRI
jgi:hypothetical protein